MSDENSDGNKVTCYTPTKGRDGATRIPRWKYDCVRRAILSAFDEAEDAQVIFAHLSKSVADRLTSNQLAKLGSVKWYVTTVKLNMECEGELERVPRLKPQTLRKLI